MSEQSTTPTNWELLIEEWKRSGLAQNKFCKIKQIKYGKFIYHKARLSKATNFPLQFSKVELEPISTGLKNEITIEVTNLIKLTLPAKKSIVRMVLNVLREER